MILFPGVHGGTPRNAPMTRPPLLLPPSRPSCVAALCAIWLIALTPVTAMAIECKEDGTQFERNFCATLAAERAERELDAALAAARQRTAIDPNAQTALTAAHLAWQAFRDAALAAAFPCYHDDITVCFGEDTPRQHALFRAQLARERIGHLNTEWQQQK
jgi:uncharacterized protein YecT (DUF1311 family)